jgi:hypothetical protein
MATVGTPPREHDPVQPINRIAGLLPPPGAQVSRPARPQARPGRSRLEAGLRGLVWAILLAPPAAMAVALFAFLLMPGLFVALVLLLVGLAPFVVVGLGVLATLDVDAAARPSAPSS